MRKISVIVILLLLFTFNLKAEELSHFQYLSEQNLTLEPGQPFFEVEISPEIFATMNTDLRDLRLFINNKEVGYTRKPIFGREEIIEKNNLEIINEGTFADGTYSFVLVLPKSDGESYLKIKLDRDSYLISGTLYGSNDNRSWQKLKPITLYHIDNKYDRVSLEGIDYKYLKVVYRQTHNQDLKIREAVSYTLNRFEVDESFLESVLYQAFIDEKEKITSITLDLKHKNRLSSGWIIDSKDQGFYRRVRVEGSNDKNNWSYLGRTYIYRGLEKGDEQLSFKYSPSYQRYLRLTIYNEDNQPINFDSIRVKTHPIKLIARNPQVVESNIRLATYWGNSQLERPGYDLDRFLDKLDLSKFQVITVDQKDLNPDYRYIEESKSWTERFPYLMQLGLLLVLGVLSIIFYRNLKEVK